jgi:hypothetical protein
VLNAQISVGLRVLLGFILLIVPGILWMLSYAVTVPVVMMEGTKARESMQRSRDLTQGERGKVFGVMFIVGIIGFLPAMAVGALCRVILDVDSQSGVLIQEMLSNLVSLFIWPLGIIGAILLYYDFRIRKEGFDLEMLGRVFAEQTESAPPVAAAGPPPVEPPAV